MSTDSNKVMAEEWINWSEDGSMWTTKSHHYIVEKIGESFASYYEDRSGMSPIGLYSTLEAAKKSCDGHPYDDR